MNTYIDDLLGDDVANMSIRDAQGQSTAKHDAKGGASFGREEARRAQQAAWRPGGGSRRKTR